MQMTDATFSSLGFSGHTDVFGYASSRYSVHEVEGL
jgi:hypothetical protein